MDAPVEPFSCSAMPEHCLISVFGDEPGRASLQGFWRASLQLPGALRSRWQARSLAQITDAEVFRRSQGDYFYDRFLAPSTVPEKPKVLFISPYPICPPVHGGGLFMYQTLRELSQLCEVHAIVLLDYPSDLEPNLELRTFCASAEFIVRGSVPDQPNRFHPAGGSA